MVVDWPSGGGNHDRLGTPWNGIRQLQLCLWLPVPVQRPAHAWHCQAIGFFRIDKGHFAGAKLDGLNMAIAVKWPGAVHEGRGTLQPIIDERADAAQRHGILSILTGKDTDPMATFWAVYTAMCEKVLDPVYARMSIDLDMQARRRVQGGRGCAGPRRTHPQPGHGRGTSCRDRAAERLRIRPKRGRPRLVDLARRRDVDASGQLRPLVRAAFQPARPHPLTAARHNAVVSLERDRTGAAAAARPRHCGGRSGCHRRARLDLCPASRGRDGHGRHGHDRLPHDFDRARDGDGAGADALERDGVCAHLRDVDGDDDRHDDAFCRADDPHLCSRRKDSLRRRQPACRHRMVRRCISRRLDRLCACRDVSAIRTRALCPARSGNGQRQQRAWRRPADRRWPLSVDTA